MKSFSGFIMGFLVGGLLLVGGAHAARRMMQVPLDRFDVYAVTEPTMLGPLLNSVEHDGARVRFIVPCPANQSPAHPITSTVPGAMSLEPCAYQVVTTR